MLFFYFSQSLKPEKEMLKDHEMCNDHFLHLFSKKGDRTKNLNPVGSGSTTLILYRWTVASIFYLSLEIFNFGLKLSNLDPNKYLGAAGSGSTTLTLYRWSEASVFWPQPLDLQLGFRVLGSGSPKALNVQKVAANLHGENTIKTLQNFWAFCMKI